MNRPSDRAIAQAFRELIASPEHDWPAFPETFRDAVESRARELDASGGGSEPVAWMLDYASPSDPTICGRTLERTEELRDHMAQELADGGCVVTVTPLYASPADDAGVRVSAVPANCRERLRHEGKPYPRSSCDACGKFSPKSRECDILLDAAAIAQFRAASTQEGG